MKPNNGLADLETRVRLVRQIAKEFPHKRGNGAVAWGSAFQAHPEYLKSLGAGNQIGYNRLMAFARHIKLGGHKKLGLDPAPVPAFATPPEAINTVAPPPTTEEKLAIVKAFAAKYPTPAGLISWKRLRDSGAEVQTLVRLGADTPKGLVSLKSFVIRHLSAKHPGRKSKASRSDTSAQALTTAEVPTIRCCPSCGFYLEPSNKAYVATIRVQNTVHQP
jgi:hypothetical protein